MVALQIRDVPEDVRDALAARARENGQSLQAFLLALVVREASFVRNLELIKEIESWPSEPEPSATAEDILDARDAARAERDIELGVPPEVVAEDYPEHRRDGAA
ncbi:FitA-like ribbon-helix-helix domain-containing protein [Streptomyces sp. 6N223]|uniref:FitA-like ribbon-helix-helix domain-containing protein n=1 Tax=Streptomyces sp. 6N223 TaxID=3457412 RepID=UPI003FD4439C